MAKLSKNGKKGAVGMGESGKKDKGKKRSVILDMGSDENAPDEYDKEFSKY